MEVTRIQSSQVGHRFPQFLPDGHHFLFLAYGGTESGGIYLGALDGGEPKRLTEADSFGAYLNPDRVVFVRQGALMARHLDIARRELTGDPVTVADPVGFNPTGQGGFSVSAEGHIAYRSGGAVKRQLRWFDRMGKLPSPAADPDLNALNTIELSPDGRTAAVDRTVQGNRDVFLLDLLRGGLTRFTSDDQIDGFPVWSPDGANIVFETTRKGSFDLWIKPTSLASPETPLLEIPNSNEWPLHWCKDSLLYYQSNATTGSDLSALPMTGNERKPIPVANSKFEESMGQFSPDCRFVAYQTNESNRFEVVVQPFPVPNVRWNVSLAGGTQPRWQSDGKELYFIAPDGKLMAASVTVRGAALDIGKPVALFPTRLAAASNFRPYFVERDGRFLINDLLDESAPSPITLILNWKAP